MIRPTLLLTVLLLALAAPAPRALAQPRTLAAQVWLPILSANAITERGGIVTIQRAGSCHDLALLHARWRYDYHTNGAALVPCGVEYVPMVWGAITQTPALTGNGAWLLGFNEPNLNTQSHLTPYQACQSWPYLEATGRLLASPAVYASPTWNGGAWLGEFMALCGNRSVAAIALHFYGCDTQALTAYLDMRAAQYPGLSLWLTEWGCLGNEAAFAAQALPLIEARTARNAPWALYTDEAGLPGFVPLVRDGALTDYGEVVAGGTP